MLNKIEHIGIAVSNLEEAIRTYELLLGTTCYKKESVESEGVSTAFFKIGESKIELLEATNPNSAIAKYIDKRGTGVHHVAFEVTDIYAEIARLTAKEFVLINELPKEGADNKMIAFLHPKSTIGMLVELCQERI
jgi:methylmalonyl-CoA/ethylmalonyl-CoA epimerase